MKNELINLITVLGEQRNGRGFVQEEEVKKTEIFAEVKSATRSEFYEALRNGIKVSVIFKINKDDFELADDLADGKKVKASKVEHDALTYKIIRTYEVSNEDLELTCEEVE